MPTGAFITSRAETATVWSSLSVAVLAGPMMLVVKWRRMNWQWKHVRRSTPFEIPRGSTLCLLDSSSRCAAVRRSLKLALRGLRTRPDDAYQL